MVRKTGSLEALRELNRLRIVDALRRAGTASRADLARETGLSRSTVSTLIADLQRSRLVVEHANGASLLAGRQGRPPVLLSLDPSAGAAVGIDFDHDKIRVAVSDLSRTVLAEAQTPADVDNDAAGALTAAAELVGRVLADGGVSPERVLGAGVAVPGPVDQDGGRLHASTILPGWRDVDPIAELERALGFPIHLDNDANLGALAEVTLGAGRSARYAAYVSISSGIGAGMIVDGRPYRGAFGVAGEIGHVVVDESGAICRCGNRGCLETLANGPALARLLGERSGEQLSIAQIVVLAQEGDPGARRVIADAGRAIGRALAALCNLFNPEMVVVGGDLSAAGGLLLDPLRESVERYAIGTATQGLSVVAGELGERANLLGALSLAIAQSEQAVAARVVGRMGHA